MSEVVLKIENISKQYRLGYVGTRSLKDDMSRWWANIRGKADPFAKIGEVNDRSIKSNSDYVWALQNINFEVKQGEVLGIIGKNGAGKSTLLKLLSKVTAPTTGLIKTKGRVASLLEVGTGFHPELTGRENIYLNGAVLGMKKWEITKKFDEIVDFAGVERYIDTPVKRYSSGMYVRLAFAVAAHLEPEVLIVDEVLAVGDAEFQKKAIGKMKEVSEGQGRTILLVSHNMETIDNLCKRIVVLENGKVAIDDISDIALQYYQNRTLKRTSKDLSKIKDRQGIEAYKFQKCELLNKNREQVNIIKSGEDLVIRLHFSSNSYFLNFRCDLAIDNIKGIRQCWLSTKLHEQEETTLQPGTGYIDFEIPKLPLNHGKYFLTIFSSANDLILDWINNAYILEVFPGNFFNTGQHIPSNQGSILITHLAKVNQEKNSII